MDWRPFCALHPDGRRLLIIRRVDHTTDHLAVIENWWPEVRELAPAGK